MSKGGSTYTQIMTKNEQMCGELCGRHKTLDNFRPGHEGSFPSRWYRKDFLEKIASELLLGLVEFWQVRNSEERSTRNSSPRKPEEQSHGDRKCGYILEIG